jgi:hypothetical protein
MEWLDTPFWEFLNSNLFIAVLGLIWGTFVADRITDRRQRKSHIFQLKHSTSEKISELFHTFTGLLYRGDKDDELFDIVHSDFGAVIDIVEALFPPEIHKGWQSINGYLLNAKKALLNNDEAQKDEMLKEAFRKHHEIMQLMVKEIAP